jgi:hypothetical protein
MKIAGSPGFGFARMDKLPALISEARGPGRKTIEAYLSAAGFDDIPSSGPHILRIIRYSAEIDMAETLGITGQEVRETIDELVRRGYLESGDAPGPRRTALTERGLAADDVAVNGLQAARWADFPFRPGDIIISTWPKTGTNWMQMICAALVFQSPELSAPLSELSPWLDLNYIPRDEIYAKLAAQEHRRIIKTHLALSEMPIDPRADYIATGRHPLDAAVSWSHTKTSKGPAPGAAPHHPPGSAQRVRRLAPDESPRESLLHWIDLEPSPQVRNHYLVKMLQHLSAAWARRDEANVLLVHYADMNADLDGEMQRIAARLGITVPDGTWPGLVQAATFDQMKANSDRVVTAGVKDTASFFRSGISGEGRALLTDEEFARYQARVAPLASPDLLAWLHHDERPRSDDREA